MQDELYNKEVLRLAAMPDVPLEVPDIEAHLDNPLCGDRIWISLKLDGDTITDAGYKAQACALCKASARLLYDLAPGQKIRDLERFTDQLSQLLKENIPIAKNNRWQGFNIFLPVSPVKSRHTCVLLPFQALMKRAASEATSVFHSE